MKTAVGGDVDAWLAQMSSGNCGGTTPTESPTPDTPEEDDGEENDSDGGGGDDEEEEDDFDWSSIDMTDTSTWPWHPSGGIYGVYGTFTVRAASKKEYSDLGEVSLYDDQGGE